MKSHTFAGKRFATDVESTIGGYCERQGIILEPELYVAANLTGLQHLTVAVHESIHACFDAATEEQVTAAGKDIARFLWRLGYRRVDR